MAALFPQLWTACAGGHGPAPAAPAPPASAATSSPPSVATPSWALVAAPRPPRAAVRWPAVFAQAPLASTLAGPVAASSASVTPSPATPILRPPALPSDLAGGSLSPLTDFGAVGLRLAGSSPPPASHLGFLLLPRFVLPLPPSAASSLLRRLTSPVSDRRPRWLGDRSPPPDRGSSPA
ncbi:putative basic proline-rich protein-like [Iris pallida]|uniref:Basic proline-rich protein-like n=1 Tax=Iris pallida TaxID=29817 RepID=A0AAX6GMI8_IRIPA|nr:putative basic proline-rich protein-like [Iris pallida]